MPAVTKKKTFNVKRGHCPVCNSADLDYDHDPEFYGETYTFAFECKKCGTVGREEHGSEFIGFNVDYSAYFMGSKAYKEGNMDDFEAQFVYDGEEVEYQRIVKKKKEKK
jgi:hypothetical protein